VLFLQTDLDEGRVLTRIAGIDCGEIRRNADIGNDHIQIMRGDDLTNVVLHLFDVLVGQLKARASWGLDIDNELARVGAGKKAQTQQRIQSKAEQASAQNADDRRDGAKQATPHRNVVVHQHPVVTAGDSAAQKRKESMYAQEVASTT